MGSIRGGSKEGGRGNEGRVGNEGGGGIGVLREGIGVLGEGRFRWGDW